jgi:hypothetical protein
MQYTIRRAEVIKASPDLRECFERPSAITAPRDLYRLDWMIMQNRRSKIKNQLNLLKIFWRTRDFESCKTMIDFIEDWNFRTVKLDRVSCFYKKNNNSHNH